MAADRNADRQKQRIQSDCLLLVEGRDEVNLFDALMKSCLVEGLNVQVQVIEAGGKDNFPRNLKALHAESRTHPTLRSIGVVRDADDNADGASRSVCGQLRSVGYEPPAGHGQFSDAKPSIGVFIVPDGTANGSIETLCRHSVKGDNVTGCVDEYLRCLDEHNARKSANVDKSFAHAYLAAMKDPVARVGEGAKKKVWNFGSPAFAELSEFLRELASRGR